MNMNKSRKWYEWYLAKGELDRAEKATKDFPLSDVAAKYYTLTSKGKNLRSALAKIPPLFLEDVS
ncbi:hypothetical protein DICVIV_00028 [Dictyocaulus viviparus]|uniref:Uncharacterized protein n=1 Tax=Dictyocaulus viviparus TaxID=29172 RepID=A0A0D8YA16_DICVI|nr:hypothetical protein DICVIV_00028 [Dictyocaulus viviparus]